MYQSVEQRLDCLEKLCRTAQEFWDGYHIESIMKECLGIVGAKIPPGELEAVIRRLEAIIYDCTERSGSVADSVIILKLRKKEWETVGVRGIPRSTW